MYRKNTKIALQTNTNFLSIIILKRDIQSVGHLPESPWKPESKVHILVQACYYLYLEMTERCIIKQQKQNGRENALNPFATFEIPQRATVAVFVGRGGGLVLHFHIMATLEIERPEQTLLKP